MYSFGGYHVGQNQVDMPLGLYRINCVLRAIIDHMDPRSSLKLHHCHIVNSLIDRLVWWHYRRII